MMINETCITKYYHSVQLCRKHDRKTWYYSSYSIRKFLWNGITIIHLLDIYTNLSTNNTSTCVDYRLSVCKYSSYIIHGHFWMSRPSARGTETCPQTERWNKTSEKHIIEDIFNFTNRKERVFNILELWWILDCTSGFEGNVFLKSSCDIKSITLNLNEQSEHSWLF